MFCHYIKALNKEKIWKELIISVISTRFLAFLQQKKKMSGHKKSAP